VENSYCPDEEDPWFYIDGDKQQAGPVTKEYLIELIKSGAIRDDSLVRSGYYIHWQQASKTPELFPLHKQQHSVANFDPASKWALRESDIEQLEPVANSLKNGTFSKKSAPLKKTPKKIQNKKAQNKLNGALSGKKPMPMIGNFTDPFFLAAALGVFSFALWLL